MPRDRRSHRRALAAAVVSLGILGVVASSARIAFPATGPPGRADAVVVFFGGQGERLTKALELMEEGRAPLLVLSTGYGSNWPGRVLCGQRRPFVVRCVTPHPASTRGEAHRFAALAEAEGWRSVIAVTTTSHVTRARLLLGRCTRLAPRFVAADSARRAVVVADVVHEWFGLAWATLASRRC